MKTYSFLLLFPLLCFAQTTKNKASFTEKKFGVEYPYNNIISHLENGTSVLNDSYKYLDSLKYYSISYTSSDNLKLKGFLFEPKKKGVYPVIIYNRGGNGNSGLVDSNFMSVFLSKIVNAGFIVIGSHLRGTAITEGSDEFGGREINDVLDLFPIIDSLPNANKEKIGVLGWSRGVMTNFLLLKKTDRITTNVGIAGIADLSKTHRKEMFGVYKACIPNYTKDSIKALQSRSSIYVIDSIKNKKVSNYIIHGEKDTKVQVNNAFELYKKLITQKYETRLLIYENQDHGLYNVFDNLIFNICSWFKEKLY